MSIDKTERFKMRFKCDPNGRLLKGAPGNFKCGEVVMQPYRMSKFAFWELVEDTPELVIPPETEEDDIFDGVPPLPEEFEEDNSAKVELNPNHESDEKIDPNAPAIMEPYMSMRNGRLVPYEGDVSTSGSELGEITVSSTDEVVESEQPEDSTEEDEPDRDKLKQVLDEAGVEYNKRSRTATLVKLVDELESEEES